MLESNLSADWEAVAFHLRPTPSGELVAGDIEA